MQLRHNGVNKISIDEDVLLNSYTGYTFIGWMPSFLQRRLEGVMSSDILEWWNNVVSEYIVKIRTGSKRVFEKMENIANFSQVKPVNQDGQ